MRTRYPRPLDEGAASLGRRATGAKSFIL